MLVAGDDAQGVLGRELGHPFQVVQRVNLLPLAGVGHAQRQVAVAEVEAVVNHHQLGVILYVASQTTAPSECERSTHAREIAALAKAPVACIPLPRWLRVLPQTTDGQSRAAPESHPKPPVPSHIAQLVDDRMGSRSSVEWSRSSTRRSRLRENHSSDWDGVGRARAGRGSCNTDSSTHLAKLLKHVPPKNAQIHIPRAQSAHHVRRALEPHLHAGHVGHLGDVLPRVGLLHLELASLQPSTRPAIRSAVTPPSQHTQLLLYTCSSLPPKSEHASVPGAEVTEPQGPSSRRR